MGARKGGSALTHNGVTTGSSVKKYCGDFNALLVHHYMTNTTTGGYVSLKMSNQKNGNYITHHGEGSNIKSSDSNASYITLFKGVMEWVEVILNVTDGTHYVTIQPINL